MLILMHVIRNKLYPYSYLCCEMNFVHQTPKSFHRSYQTSYMLYKNYYKQITSVSWARSAHEKGLYSLFFFPSSLMAKKQKGHDAIAASRTSITPDDS